MSKPEFTKQEYLSDVVFDLDDFAMYPENSAECIYHLKRQKEKFPKLKVTLFAIPQYRGVDNTTFFSDVLEAYGDWIQLAIHGWHHETPFECKEWTYKEAKKKIDTAYKSGVFVKVFKAPGWQISRDTYKALDEMGFIVADNLFSAYTEPGVLNSERRPKTLKAYTVEHPWMCHGHTWDITTDLVGHRNGIRQIIEEHGVPWDENSNFHFIEEVL